MALRKVIWLAPLTLVAVITAGCNDTRSPEPTGTSTAVPVTPTTTPVATGTLRATCDWGQKIVGCDG